MGNAHHHPAKRYSSNDDRSAVAPSKTDFMMLNPDCLLKLFEYLHLDDLIEIAEVNLMLKSLATYYFHLKHRQFNCDSLMTDAPVPIKQVEKLLSNFGDQIISLQMSRSIFKRTKHSSTNLLSWAEQYSSGYVTTLILDDFKVNREVMPTLEPLFRYIETMELIDCQFRAFPWETAENLKCLKLESTAFKWKNLCNANLKRLENVELKSCYYDDPPMIRFISTVPMLKRLSIVDCDLTTNIFGAIGQLEHLEELEFHQSRPNDSEVNFEKDLLHLTKLKQLKVLVLDCEKRSVHRLLDGFIANGVAIEHLDLAYGRIEDATIQSISKLTTIQTLKLNGMIDLLEYHIFKMTNNLQLLKEFCVRTRTKISGFGIKKLVQRSSELSSIKIDSPGFTLNAGTYKAMVAIVQKCIKQTSLSITIYSNGGQSLVADDILHAPENAKWVSVRELDRDYNHMFPYYDTDTDDSDGGSDYSGDEDEDEEDEEENEDEEEEDEEQSGEEDEIDTNENEVMDVSSDSSQSSDTESSASSDSDSSEEDEEEEEEDDEQSDENERSQEEDEEDQRSEMHVSFEFSDSESSWTDIESSDTSEDDETESISDESFST